MVAIAPVDNLAPTTTTTTTATTTATAATITTTTTTATPTLEFESGLHCASTRTRLSRRSNHHYYIVINPWVGDSVAAPEGFTTVAHGLAIAF